MKCVPQVKLWPEAGFLLRILWCSQSGDHPENNLAKFGYMLDMRVAKNQIPSVFLATDLNLTWKSGDYLKKNFKKKKKKIFKIWQIRIIFFFHEKSFV
jgi:hypothetical protein